MKNTLQKGRIRYIIFRDRKEDVWFGVGLEFNIIEEGEDPMVVMNSLLEATKGYLEAAKKMKLRPIILNQKSEKEYEELWKRLESGKAESAPSVIDNKEIHNFGYQNLQALVAA